MEPGWQDLAMELQKICKSERDKCTLLSQGSVSSSAASGLGAVIKPLGELQVEGQCTRAVLGESPAKGLWQLFADWSNT